MKHVRLVFDEMVARGEEASALCFDVVLGENDRVAHAIPYPGWWGVPRSNKWLYPAVLQPNGIINFGGDAGDNDCWQFELVGEDIRVGAELYMRNFKEGETCRFRLGRIVDLENLKETD